MVGDDVHQSGGTFQIVMPGAESLVDGEELLIVGIVVEFRRGQSPERNVTGWISPSSQRMEMIPEMA